MDQEIVVIKLAHNVRLVAADKQKNRIRFRLIFINLRDGGGKKALQVFSAVHHKLHKCSMKINSTGSHSAKRKDLGVTWDHKLNMSQQPRAHRRKRRTALGCRSARPPRCSTAVLELLQRRSCCSCPGQHWQGVRGNPVSHHPTPAAGWDK